MSFKLDNLMKQAQEMQKKMQDAQKEIEEAETTGEAGAGAVTVTMTGRHKVKRVKFDPSILEENPEVLEDLTAAAFNAASQKIEDLSKKKLTSLTAGLNLPEGLGGKDDAA